jgi:hypothetical protein
MAQPIVQGDGGVWVLVEENATMCEVDPFGVAATEGGGQSYGPLLVFGAAVAVAAFHLTGGI